MRRLMLLLLGVAALILISTSADAATGSTEPPGSSLDALWLVIIAVVALLYSWADDYNTMRSELVARIVAMGASGIAALEFSSEGLIFYGFELQNLSLVGLCTFVFLVSLLYAGASVLVWLTDDTELEHAQASADADEIIRERRRR